MFAACSEGAWDAVLKDDTKFRVSLFAQLTTIVALVTDADQLSPFRADLGCVLCVCVCAHAFCCVCAVHKS